MRHQVVAGFGMHSRHLRAVMSTQWFRQVYERGARRVKQRAGIFADVELDWRVPDQAGERSLTTSAAADSPSSMPYS